MGWKVVAVATAGQGAPEYGVQGIAGMCFHPFYTLRLRCAWTGSRLSTRGCKNLGGSARARGRNAVKTQAILPRRNGGAAQETG